MKSSYTIKFLKYRDEWGEGQYYGDSYKWLRPWKKGAYDNFDKTEK